MYSVDGYAQKGPFSVGSDVSIIELDEDLKPTGKTFESVIEDNSGKFAFPEVEFASPFVQIKVEGRAYDEVHGGIPYDELSLTALADLSTASAINVNIVTHLVDARVIVLVGSGMDYDLAKEQAERELFDVFGLDQHALNSSEELDLTSGDINGGALLLVSSIVQANTFSKLTSQEYIATLQIDFKDDGQINSEILQNALYTSAETLDIPQINENLKSYYSSMGLTYASYDIDLLLNDFLQNTNYPSVFADIFPVKVGDAINLVSVQDTVYIDKSKEYVIAFDCPADAGISSIQIAITSDYDTFPTSNVEFYLNGNVYRYIEDINGDTKLVVPFSFTGSGELSFQLHVLNSGSGMIDYPKKVVVWE